jgi:hypothetical protein
MRPETILLRQAHPLFYSNGEITSQMFIPFPKDKGNLSTYDGNRITAAESFAHFTKQGFQSVGVWDVRCAQVSETGLTSRTDPVASNAAHAVIEFGTKTEKECRKLAKKLKAFALANGCQYRPE